MQHDFADALRETVSSAFGIPLSVLYDDAMKEASMEEYGYPEETVRSLLITVGTDLFRSRWPTIWINTWANKIRAHPYVVVSDLRFPNELDKVRELGGLVLRVSRPGVPIHKTEITESFFSDFDVDFDLINDGSPTDLQDKVLDAIAKLEVSP